jgi:peptide/nickel transport system permease protein
VARYLFGRVVAAVPVMLLPGFALSMTVLGLNLVGDGLRDLLDPRQRRTLRT